MPPLADLLARAADGDRAAWDAIVDRFNRLVWSIARSYRLSNADAADVVQTTWLRLVEHLGDIREPERLAGWLGTTARNEALRVLRRSKRAIPHEQDIFLDTPDHLAPPVDDGLLADERHVALWDSMEQLPDRCQRLLRVLATDPPPSYEDVATILDMPIGSIGPTRGRCLEKLRTALAGRGLSDATPGGVNQ